MSKKYDVAIRGGGVVGHTLALLLARDRLKVALVTSAPTTSAGPDIRAYALNAASRRLLESVRAWPATAPDQISAVTPVTRMWVSDATAATAASVTFDARDAQTDALSWIVDVPALERTLAQAVGFQSGIDVMHTAPEAKLTVVCEGRRSVTRDTLGIEYQRRAYPHTAIAARLHCARAHSCVARQWFHGPEILALLPLGGESGQDVAMVWSVPHERAAGLLALSPPELARQIEQACDLALGPMEVQGQAAGWPLELSKASTWVQPGVALAGDAAHAMHPLAGQGLNVGLGDVAELARVLHAREYWRELGDLKLLRRYERARQADFSTMAWTTDGLFGLFGQQDTRIQGLRQWGLRTFDRLAPLKRWTVRRAMGATEH